MQLGGWRACCSAYLSRWGRCRKHVWVVLVSLNPNSNFGSFCPSVSQSVREAEGEREIPGEGEARVNPQEYIWSFATITEYTVYLSRWRRRDRNRNDQLELLTACWVLGPSRLQHNVGIVKQKRRLYYLNCNSGGLWFSALTRGKVVSVGYHRRHTP